MRSLLRRVPIPMAGLALGMAALGNLLKIHSPEIRSVCGLVAAVLWCAVVARILRSADEQKRLQINALLHYPKDSAGSIMTTEYVSLKKEMTVTEALRRIKQVGIDRETIYTCYVTSKDKKLVGVVTVKELLLASKEKTVAELMTENVIFAYTDEDREETVNRIRDYGLMALPVVVNLPDSTLIKLILPTNGSATVLKT